MMNNVLFRSFGREAAGRSMLYCPCDPDEVKSVFAGVQPGQRVVIRAGGHSFHDQALHNGDTNQHIVLSTDKLKTISFAPDGDANTVRLGAGVQWIEYFNAALDRAQASGGPLLLPGSMQTGRHATAGGTMSGDCLSRFSGVLGKESRWIDSFRIVLTDGTLLDVNPNNYPDLFFAAVGGHGYLGCIIDVTYKLIPIDKGSCARTTIKTYESLESLVNAQLELVGAATQGSPPFIPRAISSVWFTDLVNIGGSDKVKAGVFDSVYAQPSNPAPGGFPLYDDITSHWRYATELMARFDVANTAIHEFLFLLAQAHTQPFENDLMDFLFFMDGNTIAKEKFEAQFPHKLFPIAQQTFVIPPGKTAEFAANCESRMRDAGLRPTETDMLFVAGDECLMSANYHLDGFAVSIAFEPISDDGIAPTNIVTLLEDLSVDCFQAGGRIHL
ncbi:MAG TPA: FAD-dependent oxidoreductase, partial [Candidatus Acidoferrum sp.]|nr:FAD-dependent oxidoreductase [Candidatus Acidoferrum sp.]